MRSEGGTNSNRPELAVELGLAQQPVSSMNALARNERLFEGVSITKQTLTS